VIGFAGGTGAPGAKALMLRFDGELAAGAGVVCDVVLFVAVVGELVWANALLPVDGNTNTTPPSKTPLARVVKNFIKTLFPAWHSRPRAWLLELFHCYLCGHLPHRAAFRHTPQVKERPSHNSQTRCRGTLLPGPVPLRSAVAGCTWQSCPCARPSRS
jgi:hypothetical protein